MSERRKLWSYVAAVLSFLLSLFFVFTTCLAAGAQTADALKTDFRSGSGGWQLNGFAAVSSDGLTLIPGAEAKSEDTFGAFLAYIRLGETADGFVLRIDAGEGAGWSLCFEDKLLTAEGLTDGEGETRVRMERGVEPGCFVKIETIGNYVQVYVKNTGEPYDYLAEPTAELYFPQEGASEAGNLVLTVPEGYSAAVEAVSVFSLGGSISIETENAPPEEEELPPTVPKEEGLTAWQIALIAVGGAVAVGAAAVLIAVFAKKKKTGKKTHE